MKSVELPGGHMTLISNLENRVYECMMHEEVCKDNLSERDADIAQRLVTRGLAERFTREGKTYYSKTRSSF